MSSVCVVYEEEHHLAHHEPHNLLKPYPKTLTPSHFSPLPPIRSHLSSLVLSLWSHTAMSGSKAEEDPIDWDMLATENDDDVALCRSRGSSSRASSPPSSSGFLQLRTFPAVQQGSCSFGPSLSP